MIKVFFFAPGSQEKMVVRPAHLLWIFAAKQAGWFAGAKRQ
ncbi:MAG TPA: hypothetical protein VF480_10890 [Verrucomicrobiae bacterium]